MFKTKIKWSWFYRRRRHQNLAAVLANLVVIASGMHFGWPSPYLEVLENGNYTFKITNEESSYMAVMPVIGEIVGAMITGMAIDTIGRKYTIVLSAIPIIMAWLCIGLTSSSLIMFFGRFIAGVSDGLSFNAVPVYLGEIASPKVRGLLSSLCPVSVVFGILLIYVFGAYLALDTAALVSLSVPVLFLITFILMPESPYFYLMKGKKEKARQSLEALRGHYNVTEEFHRISVAVREQNENKGNFLDLFTMKSNRKGLFIILGLRCFQQLSGTTVIIFNSKSIFAEANGFLSSSTSCIIYAGIQLVLSTLSTFIVDISGRRPLLIVSLSGTAITLLINALYIYLKNCTEINVEQFNFVPFIALILYIIVYSIGMQTIPILMMGEIFPTNIKAFALSFLDLYFGIFITIICKFFYWSEDSFGLHVPFFTFAACSFVGVLFIVFIVPETKGKSLEDIQKELQS